MDRIGVAHYGSFLEKLQLPYLIFQGAQKGVYFYKDGCIIGFDI